jgi:hypothetical protein
MILLYNTSDKTYVNVTTYLTSIEASAGNNYRLIMLFNLDTLFEGTKKRTAWRSRFAKNEQGESRIDHLAITDDERDMFDDLMKRGCNEVFMKMSAWAKNIAGANRFNVKFGEPVESGSVTSGGTTAVLTDSEQAFVVNELAGYKLVITSAGLEQNQERTIVSNTADTITLDSAFTTDVDSLEYAVMTQTDDFIVYYLDMNTTWDLNMIHQAWGSTLEALITYFVKEWFIVNRYMDDAQIETTQYEIELVKIKQALSQRKTPLRRNGEIFS